LLSLLGSIFAIFGSFWGGPLAGVAHLLVEYVISIIKY
jgi:hypothetical protein